MNARELKEPRKKMQNLKFYINLNKNIIVKNEKNNTKESTVDSQ